MSTAAPLHVEPLSRQLLEGVVDPVQETRRIVDVGVLLWCEDERPLQGLAGFVDWRSQGRLSRMIRSGWCTGRAGESVMLPVRKHLPMRRLVLHGLGPARGLTPSGAAEGARRAVDVAMGLDPREVLLALPGALGDRDLTEALFVGLCGAVQAGHQRVPWWVVAEERHIMRLRRLLEGPPRAAES